MRRILSSLSALALVAGFAVAAPDKAAVSAQEQARPPVGAKNVILFIGDGMGVSTVTAARILSGQLAGGNGEGSSLSFESFKNFALTKAFTDDFQVTDSAAAMTAMMSGKRTNRGLINVDKDGVRGDCSTVAGNELTSWLVEAELKGLATGVVSTARVTHATPAAGYAVTIDRDFEADADLPPGCNQPDIARQLIEFPHGDGLEVVLGGGRRNFTPSSMVDVEHGGASGVRLDGRDLTAEWAARPDAEYVWNQADFDAIDPQQTKHLLGLFEVSHMRYEVDRPGDQGGEPSLTQMTEKAIEMLSTNSTGYALVVESARIDHAHHETRAQKALLETIELSNAVQRAVEMVDLDETLVVVAADHGHALTISGYPSRGNDILGLVDASLGSDGLRYTTLNYAMGPQQYLNPDGTREDLTAYDTTAIDFQQPALIPAASGRHSGEDVPLYAIGPRSWKLRGVYGQGKVGRVISTALEVFHGP